MFELLAVVELGSWTELIKVKSQLRSIVYIMYGFISSPKEASKVSESQSEPIFDSFILMCRRNKVYVDSMFLYD